MLMGRSLEEKSEKTWSLCLINNTQQIPFWGFTFPLDMRRMMLLLLGLQTILPSVRKRTKHGGKIRASAHQFRDGMLTFIQKCASLRKEACCVFHFLYALGKAFDCIRQLSKALVLFS